MIQDIKLDWPDLIVEQFGNDGGAGWLQNWSGVLVGRVAIVFMNKFGCWYLENPSGKIELLNVFTGTLTEVASSRATFASLVNSRSWQEANLLVQLVAALHHDGKVPAAGQCYAVAPHTAIGGPNPMSGEVINLEHVMVMDTAVWQAICAQALRLRRSDSKADA